MSSPPSKPTLQRQIGAIEGVKNVNADLATGIVTVEGEADKKKIADAVNAAGFEFVG